MSFALAGSQRTGKTTLAKAIAEKAGIAYHDASVTKIVKEAGINPVSNVPIAERIPAQIFLLERYLKDLEALPRPFITDRSPLDMIGYMLGEVTMHNTDPETGAKIDRYVDLCLEATRTHFDSIIFLRPLTSYAADPDKPPANPAYQWEVQMLIEGSYNLVRRWCPAIILPALSVEERLAHSLEFIGNRIAEWRQDRKTQLLH